MTSRLDVRLDAVHRRRLEELAQEKGVAISDVVRRLIDGAYEDILRTRRKRAIERLIGLNVEDPPDPIPSHASWRPPMTPAVFIDANVPIYAAGRDHLHKESCARILRVAAEDPQLFVTDSEVLQEMMHRYLALGLWELGREVLRAFAEIMHGRIEPVHAEDVLSASEIADRHTGVSTRDLVHAAVMRRLEPAASSRRIRTSTFWRTLTGWTQLASGNGNQPSPPGRRGSPIARRRASRVSGRRKGGPASPARCGAYSSSQPWHAGRRWRGEIRPRANPAAPSWRRVGRGAAVRGISNAGGRRGSGRRAAPMSALGA